MSDFNVQIGKRITTARTANGLSQKAMAEKLNISQQLLSVYEQGKSSLPLETFVKICTCLDAPFSWFVRSVKQYGSVVSEEEIELLGELKKISEVGPLLAFIKACKIKQSNGKKRRILSKSVSVKYSRKD